MPITGGRKPHKKYNNEIPLDLSTLYDYVTKDFNDITKATKMLTNMKEDQVQVIILFYCKGSVMDRFDSCASWDKRRIYARQEMF